MITSYYEAQCFFKCLEGMGFSKVCFDDNGVIVHLGSCDKCIAEDVCYYHWFWLDDPDSAVYFTDEILKLPPI